MILFETSLNHLFIGLQIQDGSDLTILDHLLHIDLVKWIATNHDVVLSTLLDDLIEEESIEEGTICLLDHAIDDLDHIFDLKVWR